MYVSLKQLKIEELKQVSGNRDVNNGGVGAGVTAASAIAVLREAGSGISRDMIAASYRAFRQVVELCIELIREFYDTPRQFRIRGAGAARFVTYDNAGLQPRSRGGLLGVDLGQRTPVFDIEVEVEKETPFATAVNNDLAMQLFRLGAFRPEAAAQTLLLLDMMDFKGKQRLKQQLQMQMQQQLLSVNDEENE